MSLAKPSSTLGEPRSGPSAVQADQLVRLVYWASAAGRQLRRCLGDLAAAAGLTDSELLTIWLCLNDDGGMVQGDLAAALGVSPAQMSGIVERLRQRGMIEMHRQTLDRRRQVWRGTTSAQQMLDALVPPLAALADCLSARVATTDQEAAQTLCQRLTEAVASLPEADANANNQSTTRTDHRSTFEAA